IECEFTALRYFTLDGCDYPSHAAQEAAIAGYIRWANRRARPKQQFAVGSKIRRPDYLPNVALCSTGVARIPARPHRTVDRVIQILETVSLSPRGVTLAELAVALDAAKSSV